MLPLTTFYRSGAHRSDVYKWDAFVTSWRFYNRAWQPQRHDRLPETSGTLWIHRGALTNQRWSLATGCGINCWKYTMSKNQPINDEHSLRPQCLGFPNSASRKHPVEVFGRCLTRERMQKWITDTYTGVIIIWYLFQTRNWLAHNAVWKRVLSTIRRLSGKWRPLHRRLIEYSIPVL